MSPRIRINKTNRCINKYMLIENNVLINFIRDNHAAIVSLDKHQNIRNNRRETFTRSAINSSSLSGKT